MSTIITKDGTEIFYKDWGKGQPIVFHHGWPLSADDWDNQMMFFLGQGYRVIAHDRRGHGRSSQTATGNDMDTYAADVAELAEKLDLMRSLVASRWQQFRIVIFPNSLPFIFAGLNVGIVLSITGALVGEFIGADRGLGNLLLQLNYNMDISGMFAVLLVLLAMSQRRRRVEVDEEVAVSGHDLIELGIAFQHVMMPRLAVSDDAFLHFLRRSSGH